MYVNSQGFTSTTAYNLVLVVVVLLLNNETYFFWKNMREISNFHISLGEVCFIIYLRVHYVVVIHTCRRFADI